MWAWPGSRWWRCDLHVHTPASHDFVKSSSVGAKEIVAAATAAGLDAVAITDHNTATTLVDDICKLAAAADPPLAIYPGLEITTSEGGHLVVLFPPGSSSDVIKGYLGCGVTGKLWGKPEALATKNYGECIAKAAELGALSIAAHADRAAVSGRRETSLLYVIRDGEPRRKILQMTALHAAEVCTDDQNARSELRSRDPLTGLALRPCYQVSDAHALDQIGRASTWIKMSRPDAEGLRLAFADGEMSLRVADGSDPNEHATLVVESITVCDGKLLGRGTPFELALNPWLNTIIGGRGTGKSSVIEFLRLALRRGDELPPALVQSFKEFARVPDGRDDKGLLTAETQVAIVYRKDGTRFRVNWQKVSTVPAIEEELEDGSWVAAEGKIAQRFPVRIYSQKQIFELAEGPESLLRVIDDAEQVDKTDWDEQWHAAEAAYLSLRAQEREIEIALADEGRLKGQLDDVNKKLAVFESSNHSDVLKEYRLRQDQLNAVSDWEQELERIAGALRDAVGTVDATFDPSGFDAAEPADTGLLAAIEDEQKKLAGLRSQVEAVASAAESQAEAWVKRKEKLPWATAITAATTSYGALLERLKDEGAGSPDEYAELVRSREGVSGRLAELARKRTELTSLNRQAEEALNKLLDLRRDLTRQRRSFLEKVLGANEHVQIKIVPYGDRSNAETSFRRLIRRDSPLFQNDIASDDGKGLLADLYSGFNPDDAAPVEAQLVELRQRIVDCARGGDATWRIRDKRFVDYLHSLAPETLDRLGYWAPDDTVDVYYSRGIDGSNFQPIQQGSPGQKTATILAFLLSYGDEPIVLDQPEDDLDNKLIYDLIVAQLRENKKRRQILIVTHNPNIVVNGDAEFVAALDFKNGQTWIAQQGGLQEDAVREEICSVMEGGRAAFEQRYQRIGRH